MLRLDRDGPAEALLEQRRDRRRADVRADVDEGRSLHDLLAVERSQQVHGLGEHRDLPAASLREQRAADVLVLGPDDEHPLARVRAEQRRVPLGTVIEGSQLLHEAGHGGACDLFGASHVSSSATMERAGPSPRAA